MGYAGGVVVFARGRDSDPLDQVGHRHFDVEFYEVGERVKLDVSGDSISVGFVGEAMRKSNWKSHSMVPWWVGLHEGIGYGHGGYNHDVHEERENDDSLIKAEEFVVFLETIVDEISFYDFKEVPIQ